MNSSERLEKGQNILKQLGGQAGSELEEVFPDFWKMTQEHLFGEVWTRPVLPLRERILLTLGAGVVTRFNPGLARTMQWALNNGISRETILDAIISISLLCGFAAAENAILVARDVLPPAPKVKEDDSTPPPADEKANLLEKGIQFTQGHFLGKARPSSDPGGQITTWASRDLFPDFWKMQVEQQFGMVQSRTGLTPRERAILAITANTMLAISYKVQLKSKAWLVRNTRNALNNGLSREEILEIILHVTHYGGWYAGENALLIVKEVFASNT